MRWYETLSAETAASKFGFSCHEDLMLFMWLLGVGDHARPIESIMPAFARKAEASRVMNKLQRERSQGRDPSVADRLEWATIKAARTKSVTLSAGFIERLSSTVRTSGSYPNAFVAMRHLASRVGNDASICTVGSYNKYVLPALGGPLGSDARNTVIFFLDAFEEKMKNGGARGLCGEDAPADDLRAAREGVRAATYPSEILGATDSSAAFTWLNGQCGGGHFPTSGARYDWIVQQLDWVRDAMDDDD